MLMSWGGRVDRNVSGADGRFSTMCGWGDVVLTWERDE